MAKYGLSTKKRNAIINKWKRQRVKEAEKKYSLSLIPAGKSKGSTIGRSLKPYRKVRSIAKKQLLIMNPGSTLKIKRGTKAIEVFRKVSESPHQDYDLVVITSLPGSLVPGSSSRRYVPKIR